MKPDDSIPQRNQAENVKPNHKALRLEFSRNSEAYSSLPSRNGVVTRKHQTRETAEEKPHDNLQSEALSYCTGRRKVKQFSRKINRRNASVSNSDEAIDQQGLHAYGVLNEVSSDYDVYGLSNLSTESIRQACGFYEDELSDDDFIEVQSTPDCFQEHPSAAVRRSIRANCAYLENCKRRKNSDESPLYDAKNNSEEAEAKPKEEEEEGVKNREGKEEVEKERKDDKAYTNVAHDCSQDDAIDVLNELDDFLDVHGGAQWNLGGSTYYEGDSKIEDCLLDLDNYLNEMDTCSVTNEEDTPRRSNSLRKSVRRQRRNRTLPKTFARSTSIEEDLGTPINCEKLQRVHVLRKSLSCALDLRDSKSPPEQTPTRIWRRSSMRKTQPLKFSVELSPRIDAEIELSTPASVRSENEETHSSNAELRRCFSQNNFDQRTSSTTNSYGMLNQENILMNLLVQQSDSNYTQNEGRPRQFGRRAEGHPRILSIRSDIIGANNNCTIVSHDQRPRSAPVSAVGRTAVAATADVLRSGRQLPLFIGSEASSVRSSHNASPLTIVSSSDSTSTAASTTGNMEATLVANDTSQSANSPLDPENTLLNTLPGFNSEWPHSLSRTFALISCTLGLFNLCRFAVLTIHYGGNFLLQFLLLSVIFGIPLFWLQMCLGAKIKSGPVSMWKISPICRGIGIALVMVQCLIAIYSTVVIAWVLVYLRDSFPSRTQTLYRWLDAPYRYTTNGSTNLTERVADYFNVIVLQRMQMMRRPDGSEKRFRVNDRLAFSLAIIWAAVFLILCKGLKSFGKVVFGLCTLPLITLAVVTCKLLYVVDPSKLQNIFTAADFDDFFINSKTWTAAAQETFLTWGLLGSSVIAITSRIHLNGNTKTTLRREAIIVVLITLFGLSLAAIMGLSCIQILNQHNYVYVPGTFEQPDTYTAVYSLKATTNIDLISYPAKWVPHYSSVIGETYRRPATVHHRESGYQALRFISELFPAVIVLSSDSLSWVWTAIAFTMFILFGVAQLCVMWKPISTALGNSTSSVLLSCVTALLLNIPFATEVGISMLHYFDILLGGSWFIPILWTILIFGVFLIRGRPYNGDDLVNDLRLSGSMSAFLALSWNVLLPIGLITVAIMDYKISQSNQFYYWRGKSYFPYWARKVAGLTQIAFLLIVPITAIVQICRYLNKGPPDILDRIQLLYRPSEGSSENRRCVSNGRQRVESNGRVQGSASLNNLALSMQHTHDDAPPKYTPPPSYTTATGARLAKILRQSIRRSIRRILGEPGRSRPILPVDTEMNQQSLPPDYSAILTNPSGNTEGVDQTWIIETLETAQRATNPTHVERSLSLGRKVLVQKDTWTETEQRPSSAPRVLERSTQSQRPYTAEDVVTVLRSSTRTRPVRNTSARELYEVHHSHHEDSYRSIENLILNAEPVGESPAVAGTAVLSNEENNSSVI